MLDDTIHVGDEVRSFDFAHRRDCYVEGELIGYVRYPDCRRYRIRVERDVWGGEIQTVGKQGSRVGLICEPPVNGTPTVLGGETAFVELIQHAVGS
jgi:hypothetical protein